MCDTFVALSNATIDGSVIFGKNSDRDPNEAHELVIVPHGFHSESDKVHCTYMSIPQVEETNSVFLAKPFWIWGAEMGANEHNVVIGNESIFSKLPAGKKPGLIGMDFLRLALERTDTARGAVDVITSLLEEYGQSGNCGFAHSFYYHNSYLIADPSEAWVLETVDKHWAAQKVEDTRSISNGITIEDKWDLASENLVSYAINKGWCKNEKDFNFKKCYSDKIFTKFSDSENRYCRTRDLLKVSRGKFNLEKAISILRDHGSDAYEDWSPDKKLVGAEVCMHASVGPIRVSQTTGSMVTQIKNGKAIHWVTGTSAPCTSIFKPIWIDAGMPILNTGTSMNSEISVDENLAPTGSYDQNTLWWHHEDLHREVLKDYSSFIMQYENERDKLENDFIKETIDPGFITRKSRFEYSQKCFNSALEAENNWLLKLKRLKPINKRKWIHKKIWNRLDKVAKRPQG